MILVGSYLVFCNKKLRGDYMSFRKDRLLIVQQEIVLVFCAVLSILVIPLTGVVILSLLFMLMFIVLALVTPLTYGDIIIMNEDGIICKRANKQMWVHQWEDVAALQRSSRYRLPSIEIVVYIMHGGQMQTELSGHYFQLSKTAKSAIKQYMPRDKHLKI